MSVVSSGKPRVSTALVPPARETREAEDEVVGRSLVSEN